MAARQPWQTARLPDRLDELLHLRDAVDQLAAQRLRAGLRPARVLKLLWLAAGGLPLAFVVGYLIGRFLL